MKTGYAIIEKKRNRTDEVTMGDDKRYGETAELEDREPIVDTLLHLSRHPKEIHEKERFWLLERRKRVRRYDTTKL